MSCGKQRDPGAVVWRVLGYCSFMPKMFVCKYAQLFCTWLLCTNDRQNRVNNKKPSLFYCQEVTCRCSLNRCWEMRGFVCRFRPCEKIIILGILTTHSLWLVTTQTMFKVKHVINNLIWYYYQQLASCINWKLNIIASRHRVPVTKRGAILGREIFRPIRV